MQPSTPFAAPAATVRSRGNVSRWALRLVVATWIAVFANISPAAAPDPLSAKRQFDVPAGEARSMLRQFAQQAGREIVFAVDNVAGIQTKAVKGEYTAQEGLDRMLAGTGLVATLDAKTGAIAVRRGMVTGNGASSGPTGNPPRGVGTIEGRVSSLATGRHLDGARVAVEGAGLVAFTDQAGFYRLANVPPGTAMVEFRHAGMAPLRLSVAVGSDQVAVRDASLAGEERAPVGRDTVELTAFEVITDSDDSYGALNSNSITSFNMPLERLPISADIYNEAFMKDVAADSIEDMLRAYGAGVDLAQENPASPEGQPGDRNGSSSLSIRGLQTPTYQRDGFIPLTTYSTSSTTATGYTSNFDLERIEVIKGPQSLLYGTGGSGGVLNMISKQARFNKAPYGSFKLVLSPNNERMATIDFGMGTKSLALRFAAVHGHRGNRRSFMGGDLEGYYLQVAARYKNTIIRLMGQKTHYDAIVQRSSLTLNAGSAANDARNGRNLRYLLATNQVHASATGPSGAGVILNGHLNWDNVDSLAGDQVTEKTVNSFASLSLESQWNSWLSSQLSVAYKHLNMIHHTPTLNLLAPNVATNPLKVWAFSSSSGIGQNDRAAPAGAARFTLLAENQLFRGRARSQSVLGADYSRIMPSYVNYQYYREGTRTAKPTLYWSVDDGPVKRPLYRPGSAKIVIDGVTYVRDVANPADPARVTPENPLGVTLGGSVHYRLSRKMHGFFGANNTEWLGGRLNTLVGFRVQNAFIKTMTQGRLPTAQDPNTYTTRYTRGKNELSYQFGANYAVFDWLRPYASFGSAYNPPNGAQGIDPYGRVRDASRGIGAEAGVKLQNRSGKISGSLAYYTVDSKDETVAINANITSTINPTGLNGTMGVRNNTINVDRVVQGVEAVITAAPGDGWRLRLSASHINGKIGTSTNYGLLYNDQFHQNAQGQVTYADGTVVYVPPTFNANQLTVPAGTPGAMPLTIAMMSNSTSPYYANPAPVTGAINASSGAGRVLAVVDPVHGPILTGATGLPISSQQINPGFTPPSAIEASRKGDITVAHPEFALNFTGLYTFKSGWVRGFKIGGTASLSWKNRGYYYYPTTTITPQTEREIYFRPDRRTFNLIAGYDFKFKRYTWSTQLNVSNLFNRYDVLLLPAGVGGYVATTSAMFSQEPRAYTWTNTLRF